MNSCNKYNESTITSELSFLLVLASASDRNHTNFFFFSAFIVYHPFFPPRLNYLSIPLASWFRWISEVLTSSSRLVPKIHLNTSLLTPEPSTAYTASFSARFVGLSCHLLFGLLQCGTYQTSRYAFLFLINLTDHTETRPCRQDCCWSSFEKATNFIFSSSRFDTGKNDASVAAISEEKVRRWELYNNKRGQFQLRSCS